MQALFVATLVVMAAPMPNLNRQYPIAVNTRITESTDAKLNRLQAQTDHSRSDLSRHLYEVSSIYTFPIGWRFPKALASYDNLLASSRSELLLSINQMMHQLSQMHRTILHPSGDPSQRLLLLRELLAQHETSLEALQLLTQTLQP